MTAPIRFATCLALGAAALGVLAIAGCASANAESKAATAANSLLPSSETAVFVTRVSGETTISWMSKSDQVYSVISKDRTRKDAVWTPVPGYENLPGTGEQMTVTLRIPGDDSRAFNVSSRPRRAPLRRPAR